MSGSQSPPPPLLPPLVYMYVPLCHFHQHMEPGNRDHLSVYKRLLYFSFASRVVAFERIILYIFLLLVKPSPESTKNTTQRWMDFMWPVPAAPWNPLKLIDRYPSRQDKPQLQESSVNKRKASRKRNLRFCFHILVFMLGHCLFDQSSYKVTNRWCQICVDANFHAFTSKFNAQITVNPSNAVNVTMELVNLTASANLKPKDLENTVEVVENLVKTLSSLDSEEITEVSFSDA